MRLSQTQTTQSAYWGFTDQPTCVGWHEERRLLSENIISDWFTCVHPPKHAQYGIIVTAALIYK